MFSLAAQFFRWSINLVVLAVGTLVLLYGSIRYEGDGRFQFAWKARPGLTGTLVIAEGAGTRGARPPSPARRRAATPARAAKPKPKPRAAAPRRRKTPGAEGCAAVRTRLAKAVARYQEKARMPMTRLDIFALLEAEVLTELPACPRGGGFRREQGEIRCSLHR